MRKTAVGVVSLVGVVIAAVGCSSAPHTTGNSAAPTPTLTASATPTPTPTPLTVTASVTRTRPVIGTNVGVMVTTLPNTRIVVIAHFSAGNVEKTRRADGTRSDDFPEEVQDELLVGLEVASHGHRISPPPGPARPRTSGTARVRVPGAR